MKYSLGVAWVLGVIVTSVVSVARADDTAVKKALAQQYAKISQAYKTKSLKSLQDVTTSDYTMTLPGGKIITRQQAEQQISTSLSFLQAVTAANEKINKVTVKGNQATVDTQETLAGVVGDMQTQGKTHTLGLTNQNQDLWVKSGGTWLRKHTTLVKGTLTTDGKSMDVGEQIKRMSQQSAGKGMKPATK